MRSKYVVAITWLGDRFHINCANPFLKISKLPEKNETNFKIVKNYDGDLSPNCPSQTCDYWLITSKQQTTCMETNIF